MKKIKVNENLLALLMFAAMFAGWQYLIIVTAFIWAFCESGKSLKDLTIKIIAVFGACSLVLLFWDVITEAIQAIFGGLREFFKILGSWMDDFDLVEGYDRFFYNPLCVHLIAIIDKFVSLLVLLVKAVFILSVLKNKDMHGLFSPVQTLVNKIVVFANNNFYEEDKGNKPTAKSRFCPKCGAKCDEDSAFCTSCGNKF